MAKRRTQTAIVRSYPVSAPAPIVIRAPRALPATRSKSRKGTKSRSGGGGDSITDVAIAGAGAGFLLDKFGEKIPEVGPVSKDGVAGIALWYGMRTNKWARLAAKGLIFAEARKLLGGT